jgi:hypothetical protein
VDTVSWDAWSLDVGRYVGRYVDTGRRYVGSLDVGRYVSVGRR